MDRKAEILKRKAEIKTLLESDGEVDVEALTTEVRSLNSELEKIEARRKLMADVTTPEAEQRGSALAVPSGKKLEVVDKPLREFRNLADQLASIRSFHMGGDIDPRLTRLENQQRASGMNINVGSAGGFAIQTDFAGMMMESAANAGELLSRVDSYDISDNADSVKWVDIDESSVATTVFGGVQVYWAAEANTVTASKPTLQEKELKLNKLMGIAYATHELEKHSNFVSDLYTRAFSLAIRRKLEEGIFSGTGAGQLLGFAKGGDKVAVAKESGQDADTVLYSNIVKMKTRGLKREGQIFLLHPDVREQLDFMSFPVGTGGVPVFLQETKADSLATLFGRPIVESDHCAALGDLGDINLVNMDEYMMIYKGGVDMQTSIHVQFLAAENTFRFIFYANGMPKRRQNLTIKNSSKTRSSFVQLAERA
jgi:HK97 family phage major capsid protein